MGQQGYSAEQWSAWIDQQGGSGLTMAAFCGSIETLFIGWELVGLSSALLAAYFHERPSPVCNAQRVWSVYRIADASFLVAARRFII